MQSDPVGLLEDRARLKRLEGRLCPLCKRREQVRPLLFDGRSLYCLALSPHGWSNPDAAEAEIAHDKPRSAKEIFELRRQKMLQDSVECGRLLVALEDAIGPWLPPEARRE